MFIVSKRVIIRLSELYKGKINLFHLEKNNFFTLQQPFTAWKNSHQYYLNMGPICLVTNKNKIRLRLDKDELGKKQNMVTILFSADLEYYVPITL